MSYIRPMGDGPITSPTQVDPSLPTGSVIVGQVPPTVVDCSQLPADSPFRQPGQACAPAEGPLDTIWNAIKPIISGSPATTTTNAATDDTNWLLWGGLAVGAYLLLRKKKR